VAARHPFQRELAREMGASTVVSPDEATRAIRRLIGGHRPEPPPGPSVLLHRGAVALRGAGPLSGAGLATPPPPRAGPGVLAGLPPAGADLAPLWFRELELVGAYGASGGLATALAMAADAPLEKLVSAVYSLSAWRTAVDHALDSGRLGAVKIAFEPGAA